MRKGLALAAVLSLALSSAAQEGILQPVPLPEATSLRAKIDRALLPKQHITHLEVEPKQVFRLVAPGQPDLLLVPVKFWHGYSSQADTANAVAILGGCGLFIIPANETPQTFVYTITGDQDLVISQCGSLLAVRRTPHDGPRPSLRLTYRTFDPPRSEDSVYVTLRWDTKAATYKVTRATDSPTP